MNVVHPVAYGKSVLVFVERILELLKHGDVVDPVGLIPRNV